MSSAIQATQHLSKDGRREQYVPKLQNLAVNGSMETRRAACERLLDLARGLPFAQEKQELAGVLKSIDQTPELGDYAETIRQRMSAVVVPPQVTIVPIPLQLKK